MGDTWHAARLLAVRSEAHADAGRTNDAVAGCVALLRLLHAPACAGTVRDALGLARATAQVSVASRAECSLGD